MCEAKSSATDSQDRIRVRVRLFAMCREAAGTDELILSLPAGSTSQTFWEELVSAYPALAPFEKESRLAVNRTYIHQPVVLQEGDEVTIIPPVSGG